MAGALLCSAVLAAPAAPEEKGTTMNSVHGIEVQQITGETVKLDQYKGNVLLIVNTASKCGFTGQYDGLQKLYETYKEKGLVVLGFPSNDFLRQEPGSNEEIQSFCRLNYGVTFPMFAKITVKDKNAHPLYQFLTSEKTNPGFGGKISWNFNKFVVDRSGKVVARFGSRAEPDSKDLVGAIKKALGD
jgi:glutathione peroxidase